MYAYGSDVNKVCIIKNKITQYIANNVVKPDRKPVANRIATAKLRYVLASSSLTSTPYLMKYKNQHVTSVLMTIYCQCFDTKLQFLYYSPFRKRVYDKMLNVFLRCID